MKPLLVIGSENEALVKSTPGVKQKFFEQALPQANEYWEVVVQVEVVARDAK